jgi:curved DNA-binding protein CbpA
MPSPYAVLGVEPDAGDGAIERAYRQRLKETHPDHGGDPEDFRAVRAAYAALRDGEIPGQPTAGESVEATSTRPVATVEYLNYDVLDDHGWSLDDDGLFEKAAAAGLDPVDRGSFDVQPDESLLEAAEHCGFKWPFACRGGACANCAVAVTAGELEMPVNHILPPEQLDRRIRLSCVGAPATDALQVVYNVKHLPGLDELRLPAYRFERASGRG